MNELIYSRKDSGLLLGKQIRIFSITDNANCHHLYLWREEENVI